MGCGASAVLVRWCWARWQASLGSTPGDPRAEEFLDKYKESSKDTGIIGHFGLGFYSSFMVADKVEIITKSYKDEPAAHWICDGSPEYSLKKGDKKERGTEIILHISKDSKDYLEENKITELLNKYNKFMPHPIKFGTKEESPPSKDGEKDEKITVAVAQRKNLLD